MQSFLKNRNTGFPCLEQLPSVFLSFSRVARELRKSFSRLFPDFGSGQLYDCFISVSFRVFCPYSSSFSVYFMSVFLLT